MAAEACCLSRSKAVCAHVYTVRFLPARGRSRGPYGKDARRDTRSSVLPIAAAILVGDAVDTIKSVQVRVGGATQSSWHSRSGAFACFVSLAIAGSSPLKVQRSARPHPAKPSSERTDVAQSDLGPGLAHVVLF
jgi:hypothetical protein